MIWRWRLGLSPNKQLYTGLWRSGYFILWITTSFQYHKQYLPKHKHIRWKQITSYYETYFLNWTIKLAPIGCHGSQFKFSHQQTVPLKPHLMLQLSAVCQCIMQKRLPTIICCPVLSFIRKKFIIQIKNCSKCIFKTGLLTGQPKSSTAGHPHANSGCRLKRISC